MDILRNKVINALELCTERPNYCLHCEYKSTCGYDAEELMQDVLYILKEPVIPIWKENTCMCSNCKVEYKDILEVRNYQYCPNCGRRFRWSKAVTEE